MILEGRVAQVTRKMKNGREVKIVRIEVRGCENANDTLDIITPEGFELDDSVSVQIQN